VEIRENEGSFASFDQVTVIQNIFAIGFNHHNSDASARSSYSLNDEQKEVLLRNSSSLGLNSLAVLSTCNRTEVYGYGCAEEAERIYFNLIGTDVGRNRMIRKNGREAIRHIFKVAAGLDSQVIGDLEILGQFKQAFVRAKELQVLNNVSERLADSSLRAAKEVRSQTRISSGTVSLSYAATRYIKDHFDGRNCEVLIVGAGKFGSRIAKNLHDYYPQATLTICNRTRERAAAIVASFGGTIADFENLTEAACKADVVISCVNDAGSFVLNAGNIRQSDKAQLFVDMSIPLSIAPELSKLPGAQVVTLDEIGKVVNETLETRREDIPLAEQIIEKHIDEFCGWANVYDKSSEIVEWKNTMQRLATSCPHLQQLAEAEREKLIGKSVARFVTYVRRHGSLPQDTEEIIRHFLKESEHAIACQKSDIQLPPDTVCC
jgi:glutamyl-tRNA reductase